MTLSIKLIFQKNIETLNYSDKTITYLRLQNFNSGLSFSNTLIGIMESYISELLQNQDYFNREQLLVDVDQINQMLMALMEATKKKDYVLLADLLDLQLNPFLIRLQELIISKEEFIFDSNLYEKNINSILDCNTEIGRHLLEITNPLDLLEQDYFIEYTSCGLFTLALQDDIGKYYLHSNGHVLHEAGSLARDWFSDTASDYVIYGLGLGYHISELMELDDSIHIKVYEGDLKVIALACAFGDLSKLLSCPRVEIIYDPNFVKLSTLIQQMDETNKFVIHYPSLRNIKDRKIKEQLEDYFISYSSVNNQLHKLNNNFRQNIIRNDEYIDKLSDDFVNKDLYIIAAGPSLDKNYLELKKLSKDSIILATGTVLKKLLSAGIKPNYVIIIDANIGVYPQIEGLERNDIPLLYLSSAYHKVVEFYPGERYLICQEGYQNAEELARKKGYRLFKTGGSVSTTAIDIGIQFGCKRIICIGLDLAYTNNVDHATGIHSFRTISQDNMRQVVDVNGKYINTAKNLDIYRKWIEKRIQETKGVEFLNATEGGAFINGMKHVKLADIID